MVGPDRRVHREVGEVRRIIRRHHGLPLGTPLGEGWRRQRFRGPYLRNALWDAGYVVDTAETALPWSALHEGGRTMVAAARDALRWRGQSALVQAHVSHVYADGASLYVTVVWPRREDPDELLDDWRAMKAAISSAVVAAGGTITHQHGVGADHRSYLVAEKSPLGLDMIRAALASADPAGIMNPSVLLPVESHADRS
jgi:alkyldihydroxyacetonephosphate synthase